MKRQIDATRMARRAARLRVILAAALCTWLLPSAASATCRDVRILLRQGYPADEVSAALGLTLHQVSACVGGVSRNRAYGPAPLGAAGPAPLGAAGPAPLGAAGPAPIGAAGPAPRGAAGPAPLGAAGPAPGH